MAEAGAVLKVPVCLGKAAQPQTIAALTSGSIYTSSFHKRPRDGAFPIVLC